jgi:hypothetical protein
MDRIPLDFHICIFLRAATDRDGKMKIKYDPLKRLKGNKSK